MTIGTEKWSSISNQKPALDSQLHHLDLRKFSQVTQPLLFPPLCSGVVTAPLSLGAVSVLPDSIFVKCLEQRLVHSTTFV